MTTDMATAPAATAEPVQEITLVDCDVHPWMMHGDVVSKRMSARWRKHHEQFGKRAPSAPEFYPRARHGAFRLDAWPDKPDSGPGTDPEFLKRQHLDEYGVDFGILIPMDLIDDYEVGGYAADMARALNDAVEEDWLDFDARLLGSIVVPHEHPALALVEIERRAGDPRWVQIEIPCGTAAPLGSETYWPIFECASHHGLPINVHVGGYSTRRGGGWPSYYIEQHFSSTVAMSAALTSFVCDGALERFPDLSVVLTEGGVVWTGPLVAALDSCWRTLPGSAPTLTRLPSEYVHDQVWFTTQPMDEPEDPAELATALRLAGLEDRLMFSTDYPHWDFDSPTQALPRALDPELRAKILAGNACALYRLPERLASQA